MAETLPGKSELTLGPEIREEISREQYAIDRTYWAKLQPFRISVVVDVAILTRGMPVPPREPVRLCGILEEYAAALFDAEASRYPASRDLESQLRDLTDRVERKILSIVPGPVLHHSLTYHATEEQMRTAIRRGLEGRIRSHLSRAETTVPLDPPSSVRDDRAQEQRTDESTESVAESQQVLQVAADSEVQRRQALLEDLRQREELRLGRAVKNREIYAAMSVDKSTFYAWSKNKKVEKKTTAAVVERIEHFLQGDQSKIS